MDQVDRLRKRLLAQASMYHGLMHAHDEETAEFETCSRSPCRQDRALVGEMPETEVEAKIREPLMALPHVQSVFVEEETLCRVMITINSEPWETSPRYEVYAVEEELLRKYPGLGLDFHLDNPREVGENLNLPDRDRRARDRGKDA